MYKIAAENRGNFVYEILAAGTDVHVIWRDSYCKMEAVVID